MLAYLMPLLIRVFSPNCLPERGPFHLGRFSYACAAAGSAFGVFVCVLFILPTYHPVTAENMNVSEMRVTPFLYIDLLIDTSWKVRGRGDRGPDAAGISAVRGLRTLRMALYRRSAHSRARAATTKGGRDQNVKERVGVVREREHCTILNYLTFAPGKKLRAPRRAVIFLSCWVAHVFLCSIDL